MTQQPKDQDSMDSGLFFGEVREAIRNALPTLLADHPGVTVPETFLFTLTQPPEFRFGQAAIACHPLSKLLRTSPIQIAERLAKIVNSGRLETIERAEAVSGHLNFHCEFTKLAKRLLPEIHAGSYFLRMLLPASQREKVLVEYSQPNTHKALHVGHLRNTVYGDAVCNLLAAVGHEVVRATYPGDLGTHIAKTLWYLKKTGAKLPTENRAEWLGHKYAEADDYIEKAIATEKGTPQAAAMKDEVMQVLRDLEDKKGALYPLYLTTREWSLEQMRETYQWLGVHFDVWYFESECDLPSRELVRKKFKEGFFVQSEGAIGIDLSSDGLGFALFLKSDGGGLYLTKDLELIRRKFEDPAVTRSIVVVDSRQKLHFQQLFRTAELMGYPQAARSEHLSYETVTTEDGSPFSSRSLTGMSLKDLRAQMEAKVIHDYLEPNASEWTSEEMQKTAMQVALGALKYGFLHVDSGGVIRFVLGDWLKLDGDTGPYLQYVHARCASLLRKQGQPANNFSDFKIQHATERELLHWLGQFCASVRTSNTSHRPSVLAAYLYDLCRYFNRFYTECPIKDASPVERGTRLYLVDATERVLKRGLEILGIPAPDRM